MQFFPQQQCSSLLPQSQQCSTYSCFNNNCFPNCYQQQQQKQRHPTFNSLYSQQLYYPGRQQTSPYLCYSQQQCSMLAQNPYGYKDIGQIITHF
ncbi:unnamed protein product [Rotaria sordida]|uniref:Uncharacterized protein n=1 Tax=Rotaria sordida TaxID=392033 RepID=A0A814M0B8_9BILA|nr:unnamed protein product [Rotaria sordida]CAF3930627.1 unnamed protein product [Rotaria sordida]